MADNFAVLTSNGTTTATFRATDDGTGKLVMMSIPTNALGTAMVGQAVMATSIPVAIASNQSNVPINIVTFGGTALTIGQQVITASIPVVLPSNLIVSSNLTQVGASAITLGQKTSASALPVVLPSDQIVSTNLSQVGGAAISLGQKVSGTSVPVTIASDQLSPLGQTTMAQSISVAVATDQTNVPIGVVGYTSFPSAVANAIRVPSIGDKMGRQLVAGGARDWKATQTTVLTTAAEATIVNAINATTFADIYGLILANGGATATQVQLRYGTGSAVVSNFYVPAGDTRGFMVPIDSAIPGSIQSANFSWTAQCLATTNMTATVFYVKSI